MSSACYVYAIVRRGTPLPALGSDGGAELAMVPWRDLSAVTRRTEDNAAAISVAAILHHEAIVEGVRAQGPALPVRFGTVFRDETSLTCAIAEGYQALAADLDRLGDKIEMGLTALWSAPGAGDECAPWPREEGVPTSESAGARYLHARAAELRHHEALQERASVVAGTLDQVLGVRALEQRQSLLPTRSGVLRAAYLLNPRQVSDFRAAFDALSLARRDLGLLLTGPWPPYSFVRRTETECPREADAQFVELLQILTNPASLLSRCGARLAY
ncbi:MAG TPA: GvpL/GvpF family gas vesicle protein [Gemmatimonadaceae bacterium]|nr:GvpL/GvpF family gas vesicle protein [Gemmatimonadaceae bacterium]